MGIPIITLIGKSFASRVSASLQNQVNLNNLGTTNNNEFIAPNIIIAGGVGSFEPRKFQVKECEKFENKSVFYSIKDKTIFKNKTVSIRTLSDSETKSYSIKEAVSEMKKLCKIPK